MNSKNPAAAKRQGPGMTLQGISGADNAKLPINCQAQPAAERSLRAIRLSQLFGLTPVTAELVAELAYANGRHA